MASEIEVVERLSLAGLNLAGSVVKSVESPERFFVFVRVLRNDENRQIPSNLLLKKISSEFEASGVKIEFILKDGMKDDLEAGVRATVIHYAGDKVRNAFLTVEKSVADIWIVPKVALEETDVASLIERIKTFLNNVDVQLGNVNFTNKANVPTKTACIAALRRISPSTPTELVKKLKAMKFDVPSEDWMARMLDNLRKSGLVVRLKNGTYVLTLKALRLAGTAKNGRSADISRMLDLAKRSA